MAFDGVTCEDGGKVLKSQSSNSSITAFTDYGLFKNNIPGLGLQDMRSYSAVTVEFWVKFDQSVFFDPEARKNKEIVKMTRVDY